MNRFLKTANKKLSVSGAAWLLSGSSLIVMVLGLWRESLISRNIGFNNPLYSAYVAAFQVPDLVLALATSGALGVTFIPVFSERLAKGNKKSAFEMTSSLLNFLALVTFVASIFTIIFAGTLARFVAPGFDDELRSHVATMMRLMAINPFLFAISTVFIAMQQAVRRFFFVAFAPAVYSLSIIFGVVYFYPRHGIEGVAFGVIIGSILQLIVAACGLYGMGYNYQPKIVWKNQGFRQVLKLLPIRAFDQGIDNVNSIIENVMASGISKQAIGLYSAAFRLHTVPVSIIGVAISNAAFPQMIERINQGRPDLFKKEFINILRVIIWLSLPAATIAYFGRGYLVRLYAGSGNKAIASLLGVLVISIVFRPIFYLLSRIFYAQGDIKTPFYISLGAVSFNILAAVTLARKETFGLRGLAMAQAFTAVFEVMIQMLVLVRRYPGLFNFKFFGAILRMLGASAVMSASLFLFVKLLPLRATDIGLFTIVPKFGIIVILSFAVYLAASALFQLDETSPIVAKLRRLVFTQIRPTSRGDL
jgi:putative peptidoglycan lipid II flippase